MTGDHKAAENSRKKDQLDKIHVSFARQAEHFDSYAMELSRIELLDRTIRQIAPESSDSVLDAAAGTGVMGRALAPLSASVTCLDTTPGMLDKARELAEEEKLGNLVFVLGDAGELPFLDGSFNIVVTRLSFHHFEDPGTVFGEMHRVLKTGGKLVLIDMEAPDEDVRDGKDQLERLRDPSHYKNLSRAELENLYEIFGMELAGRDSTRLAVRLESWLKLTETPEEASMKIRQAIQDELDGGSATGFEPFLEKGEIWLLQRWLTLIGRKL